ncbi:MAG: alpha/beta fold hydrolase [Alphaproteobacteria bacterium]|jgi:3-oxoadipate enol-lactonase|nr:alpha/beta fold hydrolase [Alphaproteobacteria bacterium]
MMRINGKNLAVEIHGDGEAMIMIHGLGGSSNAWMPQCSVLSRTHKIIRPDLEGSGRSPAKGKISIASFMKDVFSIMDKLEIKSAHFLGHSLGTVICAHMAAKSPSRVKSLALLGPVAEPPQPARQAIRDRAALARKEGMVPIADVLVQVSTSAETKASKPAVAALVREIVMRQDAEGYARTCEALAAAKAADFSKIKCPTLLITGDEDGVAPPAAAKAMAKAIKKSELLLLSGCGHWTPIEKPTEVNDALLNFYYG